MKRIYIYLLSAIVSLAFAPAVSAQTITDVIGEELTFKSSGYTINNNVGISKQVSSPMTDGSGRYWIKLEAFATGEASVTSVSKPADIILVLDCSSSMDDDYGSTTRIAALKTACKAFLETIYNNDAAARELDPSYAGDRVAIVSFTSTAITRNDLSQISTSYTTLNTTITNLTTSQGTYAHLGLAKAMEQWQSEGAATSDPDRSRAVVFFTDGCPSGSGSYAFQCGYAGPAVNYATQLKRDYGASVYTVGLFDTSNVGWTSSTYSDWRTKVLDYMNFVSSNFSGVTATYTTGSSSGGGNSNIPRVLGTISYSFTGYESEAAARASENYADAAEAAAGGGGKFFFMASDDPSSLESIFETIASQTGGAANTQLTAASTTTVDVVSESFLLPENAVANDIKVFTAKCTGTDPYTFATEVQAGHDNTTDVDDNIGVVLGIDANGNDKISVTGFDYSHNWCGPIKNASGTITGYQGYKIIIMIPIIANPDAVGGPNVVTNTAESGIYIDGQSTPLIPFEYPTVSLPVNIYIEKAGLKKGESAKFIIEKAVLPDSGDPADVAADAWSYVTSIFVTRPQSDVSTDNPVVKIKGLPAAEIEGEGDYAVQKGLVYRIREEGWSWSYTYSTDPKYTVSGQVNNPFVFTNTPKENIDIRVRHAESKATNTFKTGGGFTYDDSKTNVRP